MAAAGRIDTLAENNGRFQLIETILSPKWLRL
jgi:hypothetical protein